MGNGGFLMKKLLLWILISMPFCIQTRAVHSRTTACIQAEINQKKRKRTWSSWICKQIGWNDPNRLNIEKEIHLLQAEYNHACIQEIDEHNKVFQTWKNNIIANVHSLKLPALAIFVAVSYMNAPVHDGTIPGRLQSAFAGGWTTTKNLAEFTGSTLVSAASVTASTTSNILKAIAGSIDSYLRHQYQIPTK